MLKRTFAAVVAVLILISAAPLTVAAQPDIDATAAYVLGAMPAPPVTLSEGVWAVLTLARSGSSVPDAYYDDFYIAVAKHLRAHGGVIDDRMLTSTARVAVALIAAGYDARDVAGYDLIAPLANVENALYQGINGAVWSLLALDCGGYDGFADTRDALIAEILSRQLPDGRFTLSGKPGATISTEPPESDITCMTLQALAPYRDRADVADAVERAFTFLSQIQKDDGGYESRNTKNCESAAQVALTLAVYGLPRDDERFVKNGKTAYDAMITFRRSDGSFAHIENGRANLMATEQSLLAMIAVERFENGKTSVYDMSDVAPRTAPDLSAVVPKYIMPEIVNSGASFDDIADSKYREAVEALAERGIITGYDDGTFRPDNGFTRAHYCALITRALRLPDAAPTFTDVSASAWYAGEVGAAELAGLVAGVGGGLFNPEGMIRREEAALMLARAVKSVGINVARPEDAIRDALSAFGDGSDVSDWAREAVAFCFDAEILDAEPFELEPRAYITRGEAAFLLINALRFIADA